MAHATPLRAGARGFTLTELAIVMMIVALLAGGLLMTLAAQNDNRELVDTRRTLETARDALMGFAIANGRLPCPATTTSNGQEAPLGGGACTITLDSSAGEIGFLPAITLGIGPTNDAGHLLDAWGNPVRYAVTRVSSNAYTTAGALRAAGYTGAALIPDLNVCVDLPTAPAGTCAAGRTPTAVAAVVFSPGKSHATSGPLGADEVENINRVPVFVTRATVANFDDILVTISPNVLFGRLIAAGAL